MCPTCVLLKAGATFTREKVVVCIEHLKMANTSEHLLHAGHRAKYFTYFRVPVLTSTVFGGHSSSPQLSKRKLKVIPALAQE